MNVTAESQGRLQVARLYQMTEDKGVRDFLSFLLARDTMHQNQWLAAIEELRADGLEDTPCPSNFPQEKEATRFSYQFMNFSQGTESATGRWATGPAPDGKGSFEYVEQPQPHGDAPDLDGGADPRWYGTPPSPAVGKAGKSV